VAGRVDGFMRGLEAVNRRLAPPFMRRLDRNLVTRRPLVWRSRVHWAVWWSIVASVLGAVGAVASYSTLADVPARDELYGRGVVLQYLSFVAWAVWAVIQLRIPSGELGLARALRSFALNVVVLWTLLLPMRVFEFTLFERVGSMMTDADFGAERALYESYPPELCAGTAITAVERHRILASLARYGVTELSSNENLSTCWCHRADGQLAFSASLSSFPGYAAQPITSKLESIRIAKNFWHGHELWRPWCTIVAHADAIVALGVALLLVVASRPHYTWRRDVPFLGWSGRRPGRVASRRKQPLGQWLLKRYPLSWAAGAHRLPLDLLGTLAGTLLLFWAFPWLHDNGDTAREHAAAGLALTGGTWPYVWLARRRSDLGWVPTTPWRRVLASGVALTLPVAVVLAALGGTCYAALNREFNVLQSVVISASLATLNAWFVASVALVRTYRRSVAIFAASTVVVWSALAFSWWMLLIVALAAYLLALLPSRPGVAQVMACVLLVAPPVGAVALFLDLEPDGAARAIALAFALALALPFIYFVVLAPVIGALARAQYEPRRE
jgi:hypothetical protein